MSNGWLNVPHHKQELPYSCVAACVRMILAHHGCQRTETELRLLLGTTSGGTPARNLLRVGSLGFRVALRSSNLSELLAAVAASTPPIVFLQTGSLPNWALDIAHVAVFVGADAANVYLNDPFFDSAPQVVPLASFLQAWAAMEQFTAFLSPQP
jgi:ABC-type bacteriocin/lantibiotic exporter with double-glycine peptidase domain